MPDQYTTGGRYAQTVKRWTVGASGALQESGSSTLQIADQGGYPVYNTMDGWWITVDSLWPVPGTATTTVYVANSSTSSRGTANVEVEQWLAQMCSALPAPGPLGVITQQYPDVHYERDYPVWFLPSALGLTLDTCGPPTPPTPPTPRHPGA